MKNLTSIEEGKTNAIISYLTIIGTIVAIVLNNSSKNAFASFHIRQNIGLNIFLILNSWLILRLFGYFGYFIVGALIAVLWFIGLMGAINGDEKKSPIVGDLFQDWFKSI
ncbi:hypothetical protein [uncultured Tenacibaculum sp.]|uniref:hypothetical protein n=1 Tax=uncultured Tenacibaculum sp. TaxID=174713 RepID=UPI00261157AA|nr:hypothetical protein [uncultured Tenacibaculum sp.]